MLVIYLSEIYGVSDIGAGIVLGFLGILTTIYSMLFGAIPDIYGIKKSMVLSSALLLIAYCIILIFPSLVL